MDIQKLEDCIKKYESDRITFTMITITNNTGGWAAGIHRKHNSCKKVLSKHNIPLVIDACRFAENTYFSHERKPEYQHKSLLETANEIFSYADGATMSCKKEGLANMGGFIICNDDKWAEKFTSTLILREGFPTYGELAGRNLEVIAVGIMKALGYDYQRYRHAIVEYLGDNLERIGVPIVKPVGGHAVFIDAKAFLPNIQILQYPGVGLVNALYIKGGIRTVELGTLMFGHLHKNGNEQPSPLELVRLAIPRRVYTQNHFDYLIEVIEAV